MTIKNIVRLAEQNHPVLVLLSNNWQQYCPKHGDPVEAAIRLYRLIVAKWIGFGFATFFFVGMVIALIKAPSSNWVPVCSVLTIGSFFIGMLIPLCRSQTPNFRNARRFCDALTQVESLHGVGPLGVHTPGSQWNNVSSSGVGEVMKKTLKNELNEEALRVRRLQENKWKKAEAQKERAQFMGKVYPLHGILRVAGGPQDYLK
ncbi:MAG: hypothetical protein V4697_01360 [Patescibacteria group bacterium]